MSNTTGKSKAAAGWYRDPKQPGKQRRWDGQGWVDEWRDPPVVVPLSLRPEAYMISAALIALIATVVAGLVFAMDSDAGWVAVWAGSALASVVLSIGIIGKGVEVGLRASRRTLN